MKVGSSQAKRTTDLSAHCHLYFKTDTIKTKIQDFSFSEKRRMSSDLICSMYTDIESPNNFNEFDQYREQQREKDL